MSCRNCDYHITKQVKYKHPFIYHYCTNPQSPIPKDQAIGNADGKCEQWKMKKTTP